MKRPATCGCECKKFTQNVSDYSPQQLFFGKNVIKNKDNPVSFNNYNFNLTTYEIKYSQKGDLLYSLFGTKKNL